MAVLSYQAWCLPTSSMLFAYRKQGCWHTLDSIFKYYTVICLSYRFKCYLKIFYFEYSQIQMCIINSVPNFGILLLFLFFCTKLWDNVCKTSFLNWYRRLPAWGGVFDSKQVFELRQIACHNPVAVFKIPTLRSPFSEQNIQLYLPLALLLAGWPLITVAWQDRLYCEDMIFLCIKFNIKIGRILQ